MKNLYPSPSTNIVLPNGKFDDNFAEILNELIKYLNQYYKDSVFTFENNTNDTKGLSIIVKPKDDKSAQNIKVAIEQVQKKYPKIQFNGSVISLSTTENKSTPITTQTTTKKDQSNVYSMAAMKAMTGGLIGESKLEEQINRIKKLL